MTNGRHRWRAAKAQVFHANHRERGEIHKLVAVKQKKKKKYKIACLTYITLFHEEQQRGGSGRGYHDRKQMVSTVELNVLFGEEKKQNRYVRYAPLSCFLIALSTH